MGIRGRKVDRGQYKKARISAVAQRGNFVVGRAVSCGVVLVLIGFAGHFFFKSKPTPSAAGIAVSSNFVTVKPSVQPGTLNELLALPPPKLEECDIALMNLLCAQGLRGAEGLDIPKCMETLDNWARRVDSETQRHLRRFREKPEDYRRSEAYFRMLMLSVVVQQDFQVGYNPARMAPPGVFEPNEVFFADSKDVLLHGILDGRHMGTCSSLPVLYVALGRRLGYPLKLVTAKNHLFVRWEDSRGRLNIEATARGFNTYEDDYYKSWPLPMTDEEMKDFGYLKPLTATEELAEFLSTRGACLMSMERFSDALENFDRASRLVPDSLGQRIMLEGAQAEVMAKTRFPTIPGLPDDLQPDWKGPPKKYKNYLPPELNPVNIKVPWNTGFNQ